MRFGERVAGLRKAKPFSSRSLGSQVGKHGDRRFVKQERILGSSLLSKGSVRVGADGNA